jgi:hypothetical protein
VKSGTKSLNECFSERTSYAGMRACDVANPCRDDYICLRPMGYTAANSSRRVTRLYQGTDAEVPAGT